MKVHIFNPENDLALADGRPGYTAPASARQMRKELHWLPEWWAEEGDLVWDGESSLQLQEGDEICPWGWSPALIHQLKQGGVADSLLPTPEQMDHLRWLSHRRTAVEALAQMRADRLLGETLCGASRECKCTAEVSEALAQWPRTLFKAPWSCSGKGLVASDAPDCDRRVEHIMQHQGRIIAEQMLHKITDFALEFMLDAHGGAESQGLSLFHTNEAGAYTGNWLAPEPQKLAWLAQYADPRCLMDIRQWWEQYLRQFSYRGPVGIDMMLCHEGICPCVEINWRMTMGMVGLFLTRQGRSGKLLIYYMYGHYVAEVEAFG